MREKIRSIHTWLQVHERHLSSLALLGGFILDAFTLRRVDLPFENILIISYFLLLMVGIVILHVADAKKYKGPLAAQIPHVIPLAIQFAFGGLFSGFTIFYFRSGSIVASWPFIFILVALLLGNELLRRHYARMVFQISTFFTALFFFTIFFIPVLISRMDSLVFVLSGLIALVLTMIFIGILYYFVPDQVMKSRKPLTYSIISIFVCVNVLYFLNVIPPIPLSLKNVGVYHSVAKQGDKYVVLEEEHSQFDWLEFFRDVHVVKGDLVYVYSAVFAPTDISTEIVHHWRYFDKSIDRWVSVNKIPYTIFGGSDRGHRGYSWKTNLAPGDWSVDVETTRGQVVGRILFEVIYTDETPKLIEKIL